MKKLIFILLLLPFILLAQVRPGGYKVKLADDRLYLELSGANALRAGEDCKNTRIDCNTQAWELQAVPGKANTFHIVLVNGGKYLTWNNEGEVNSRVLLLPRYTAERIKYQSFLVVPNDKGSLNIQPAIEGTAINQYFLGVKRIAGSNNVAGILNRERVDWTSGDYSISWVLTSSEVITRLPIQTAQPGVVSTPSTVKVTKLPVKPPQPGVVSPPTPPTPTTSISTLEAKPGVITSTATITIETLTGGDDLRGGNDNVDLTIGLKFRPVRDLSIKNLNEGQKWDNFSENKITRTITAPNFTFSDVERIIVRHTGGTSSSDIGLDNWYLDKLKISLTIGGVTKILVDLVDTPIHYFKGNARQKIFLVNH